VAFAIKDWRRVPILIRPEFSRYRLCVDRSPIHRRGVFALEPIPCNRRVIEYTGARMSRNQTAPHMNALIRRGPSATVYVAKLNRSWYIDGAVGPSGAQFINHSCDPNLAARRVRGRLLFFSRRKIHAGEELTADYRLARETIKLACRCGSPNCRGTLNRL
jgi:SET domain-containing protein